MPFTRMDQLQPEDMKFFGDVLARRQAAMPQVIKGMLRQLDEQVEGMTVTQLAHSLQTATRALRAGASAELTVAALCHDVGEVICDVNHGAIAAEILKPYVSRESYEVVRTHQDFQGRYIYAFIGRDPDAYRQYADMSWFELACRFSDEWDQRSFDPDYDTLSLEHFEPIIDKVFARPRVLRNTTSESD